MSRMQTSSADAETSPVPTRPGLSGYASRVAARPNPPTSGAAYAQAILDELIDDLDAAFAPIGNALAPVAQAVADNIKDAFAWLDEAAGPAYESSDPGIKDPAKAAMRAGLDAVHGPRRPPRDHGSRGRR